MSYYKGKTNRPKIKAGQIWRDRKSGDIMKIIGRHHDKYWNCVYERSARNNHKNTEFIIYKYYDLIK